VGLFYNAPEPTRGDIFTKPEVHHTDTEVHRATVTGNMHRTFAEVRACRFLRCASADEHTDTLTAIARFPTSTNAAVGYACDQLDSNRGRRRRDDMPTHGGPTSIRDHRPVRTSLSWLASCRQPGCPLDRLGRQTDRRTDRQTDGSRYRLTAPYGGG